MIGGRFRIEEPIAQDNVGRIYRAFDTSQGAPAAVRVIPLRLLGASSKTLEVDVEKASAVIHKNLVSILMIGREADFYFIATELMDGQSLREFMDGKRADGRGISFKGAYNLLSHIANGLEKAHDLMAHGGLNPASVWVNKAGRVKVTDLGLARTLPALGRRGAPPGSPDHLYVAPEMIAGAPPSAAADVFSLGVILYEVLAGRPPSGTLTPVSQLAPDVPAGVDAIIERALSRSPQARWTSPGELKRALAGVMTPDAPAAGATAPDAASGAEVASAHSGMVAMPTAVPHNGTNANGASSYPVPTAPIPGVSSPQMPAQPATMEGGRLSLGTPFNVMDAANAVGDENLERWLVQKDKLDFGPFSLAQIRAQIDRGEILSEHLIVDTDSGERWKIKEFPGLGEFTKSAERKRERERRARAEQAHESVEKKKSVVTFLVGGLAVLVVLGGIGLYVLSRKDSDGGKLASREEEAEVDAFLKDVKIELRQGERGQEGDRRRAPRLERRRRQRFRVHQRHEPGRRHQGGQRRRDAGRRRHPEGHDGQLPQLDSLHHGGEAQGTGAVGHLARLRGARHRQGVGGQGQRPARRALRELPPWPHAELRLPQVQRGEDHRQLVDVDALTAPSMR